LLYNIYYETLGTAPNRRLIVEFNFVPHQPSGDQVTVQLKLFEGTNGIEVHAQNAATDGGTHSVGIEDPSGADGLTAYRGTQALPPGWALRFSVCNELDLDGDGVTECDGDCDDADPLRSPSLPELCDGRDNDCDGAADDGQDADGDGVTACGVDGVLGTSDDDCDPLDPAVYPGATELCNGIDDDCDAAIDDNVVYVDHWPDQDGDGFGDGATLPTAICDGTVPVGQVPNGDDCNDAASDISPGATELCDGVDNDCDGTADDVDQDGDGHTPLACGGGDCDDTDPAVAPGATERCNSMDDDCDGLLSPAEVDDDLDGFSECDGDCDDTRATRAPGLAELCNNSLDDDCDGLVDESPDADGDGVGSCNDCDDADPTRYPGALERCDGLDNDCDGVVPERELDADGDGFAPCRGDCADGDPSSHPGAVERCDGADNDCDGFLDPEEDVDTDGDGFALCEDCDDLDAEVRPGAVEHPCATRDMDCDGEVPDGRDCVLPGVPDLEAGGCACNSATTRPRAGFPLWVGLLLGVLGWRTRSDAGLRDGVHPCSGIQQG
jgi:hypothetical protein